MVAKPIATTLSPWSVVARQFCWWMSPMRRCGVVAGWQRDLTLGRELALRSFGPSPDVREHQRERGNLLIAVGRVMLDFWTRTEISAFEHGEWASDVREIRVDVGGPTHVCAGFLASGGWDVQLVSAVGASSLNGQLVPDHFGILALQRLDEDRIPHSCAMIDGRQTGRVMILYPSQGGRLMIADNVTAPAVPGLHVEAAIREATSRGRTCLVYVDGYTFFDQLSSDVPPALARRAKDRAALWIDVLPHTIHRTVAFDAFLEQIRGVDVVSMDLSTLFGFAGGHEGLYVAASRIVDAGTVLVTVDDGMVVINTPVGESVLKYPAIDRKTINNAPGQHDRVVGGLLAGWVDEYLPHILSDWSEGLELPGAPIANCRLHVGDTAGSRFGGRCSG